MDEGSGERFFIIDLPGSEADAGRNEAGDAKTECDEEQQLPRRHGQSAAGADFFGGEG